MSSVTHKTCSVCRLEKILDDFHNCKKGKLGCKAACKDCRNTERMRSPEEKQAIREAKEKETPPEGMKKCTSCRTIKPQEDFSKQSKGKDGYTASCKTCNAKRSLVLRKKTRSDREAREDIYGPSKALKICRECVKEKVPEEFYRDNAFVDGRSTICKACDCIRKREWSQQPEIKTRTLERSRRPEVIAAVKKVYIESGAYEKDKIYRRTSEYHAKVKVWRDTPEAKVKAQLASKHHYDKNTEKRNKQQQENYILNREKYLAYARSKYAENSEEINNQKRFKHRTTPEIRLRSSLIGRRNTILKKQGTTKAGSSLELLGCSIEEWMSHLESTWTEGMSWDNYTFDGWHVDHIRPCSSFDMIIPEEQFKCFHWSNTQALWGIDNIKKSNKW